MGDCRENEKRSTGGRLWGGGAALGGGKWLMKLIKRSIQICFPPLLTISRALARVCTLCFTLTTFCLLFVYLSVVRKCVSIKTEHEIKERDVAFVIFYHRHFYCISVKYIVCMHVSVFVLLLLLPWQRQKKEWKKGKKMEKKNQAHSSYCVEIPPYF